METFQNLIDGYHRIMQEHRDPRVDDMFLMSSPLPTILICSSYFVSIKYIGPKWMESRKPYDIKLLLIFYNLFQIGLSSWIFWEYGQSGWFNGYSYKCQPVEYSPTDPKALRMLNVCWWYYFSKFTEFFDTFFFVLRKKTSHVSPLHIIHHGIMPMSVWFGVKFTPGGHSTFFSLLNSFIHILMYSYYLLCCFNGDGKYIWWKKYLTALQMVQFVAIAVHSFQLLFIECDYPIGFVYWIGGHGLLFLVLFTQFYIRSYSSNKHRKGGGAGSSPAQQKPLVQTQNGSISNGKLINNGSPELNHNNHYDSHELRLRAPYTKLGNGVDLSESHQNSIVHLIEGPTAEHVSRNGQVDKKNNNVKGH